MIVTPEAKLRLSAFILALILLVGTTGYMLIEGWAVLESLYMTVITLSTVGYGEVQELSLGGKIFTIFLIFLGLITFVYAASALGELLIEGQLLSIVGRRKMGKKVKRMKDHIILCGFGRVGRQVAQIFAERKVPFIIVEKDPRLLEGIDKSGHVYLAGSAAEDEVLQQAGISKAMALVSTLPDDSENVYLALSAKQMNPELFVIARADTPEAEKKLKRAGADKVICPHEIGGIQMAMATLRPNVVDFMQLASIAPGTKELGIEEIAIHEGASLEGRTIIEAAVKSKYDAIVVGLRKGSGKLIFNPPGETRMEKGDILIVLGENDRLESLAADLR
jgi:voltage-gated potassium channel